MAFCGFLCLFVTFCEFLWRFEAFCDFAVLLRNDECWLLSDDCCLLMMIDNSQPPGAVDRELFYRFFGFVGPGPLKMPARKCHCDHFAAIFVPRSLTASPFWLRIMLVIFGETHVD